MTLSGKEKVIIEIKLGFQVNTDLSALNVYE